ncbi:glycosyltransferase [Planctomycetota bacterium]
MDKIRVLFVGEAVTLAHVVRPLELAKSLDGDLYDVVFSCDERYRHIVERSDLSYHPLDSIPSETFLRRVYNAESLYKIDELEKYVRDDLKMISDVRPDVVVGDFRLSLDISCSVSGVPYVALSNVHWSPHSTIPCPVPEHPVVKLCGVTVSSWILRVALPVFFWVQTPGINRLRKKFGLPPLRNAQEVFTRGTRTLYMDIPELYDADFLSDSEHCIGPVNWVPDIPLPEWWNEIDFHKRVVFVSPGSSGDADVIRETITTLRDMDLEVIVATAGRFDRSELPGDVHSADFIPGLAAAEVSDIVICNGGSGMVYQSLTKGTPVLGIPSNIDQFYVMEAVERQRAGELVRASRATPKAIKTAVEGMLSNESYGNEARRMRRHIRNRDSRVEFVKALDELMRVDRSGAPVASQRSDSPVPIVVSWVDGGRT